MSGKLSFNELKSKINEGVVDTVLVCLVDMQGRLMGKRFHAQNFIEYSFQETHCCNYLLATDLEMATPDGYASTSWQSGYGDYVMKPDLDTIRLMPWLDGTAMVLCDVLDHHTHEEISHSPRSVLKRQIARLDKHGFTAKMATELEFFLFEKSFDEIRKSGFRELEPISGYNEDYHILQTTKEEHIMRPLRNHLYNAGIPIENSKGEAEAGQEELNIRYDEAMLCADHHTIAKHATKEIAWQQGHAATFLPKWDHNRVGSSSHVHQSLWTKKGESVFFDKNEKYSMSKAMQHYVAGLIKYAPDYTYFLAPYVNSYKRFASGTFAPTKVVWSVDNRTAGFRLCGADTKGVRMECRIGGSDINPYLALAAQLAAGIKGLEEKLELTAPTAGDVYSAKKAVEIPSTLRAAMETLRKSKMLKEAFGDDVVLHYTRAAQWEQEEFDRVVTDWEIARGLKEHNRKLLDMVKTLECISPIDGSIYATREILDMTSAKKAVVRAKSAQKDWAKQPLSERIKLVMAGVAKVGETTERMAEELAHQMGRPIRYGGEFGGFEERASYMASIAEQALEPIVVEDSDNFLRKIEHEPQGVVFVVAPWNYPYMTAINTIAPALISGNVVILKHATQTLLVGERMAEAFHEVGIPDDVFQNVFLDHETTSKLISEKSFDFVNFTGSVGGGRAMERAAAGTFTAVSTELGGKDPGYVMEDADLDAAVDTLIDGAMFNSGQCCCGIERIYVHESLFDAFVEKAVAIVKSYKLGNPLDKETSIGPMANVRFAKEVRNQIEEALTDGAIAHIETFAEDDGGAYLTPQILTNVNHKMRVMRDESFGPVVGIMKVSSDEEAIALMNDSQFGLTASLWTSDANRADRIGAQIETGTVFMNRCDYLDPALCWTGCKDTGRGTGLSVLGFHALTKPKSYHLKKA